MVVRALPAVLIAASLFFAGCGGGDSESTSAPTDPMVAKGKELAAASCLSCHTTNGTASSGPTWKGLAGSQVPLADGRTVTADDEYLKRSIQDPGADQVADFTRTMEFAFPPGTVSDEDADALVAYIKSLQP